MFCTGCGATIADDAKFCPYCGEDLAEVKEILKEPSGPSDISSSESDFKLSLEGNVDTVYATATKSNEFSISIQNASPNSIPGVKVQLSALNLNYIEILSGDIYFGTILSEQSLSASFIIRSTYIGTFTLTAKILSDVGHSLTFPIYVTVRSPRVTRIPITRSKPQTKVDQGLVGFIIVAIVGLILIGIGVSTFFRWGFTNIPTTVTLIVIGLIFIAIGTKGQCCECVFDEC